MLTVWRWSTAVFLFQIVLIVGVLIIEGVTPASIAFAIATAALATSIIGAFSIVLSKGMSIGGFAIFSAAFGVPVALQVMAIFLGWPLHKETSLTAPVLLAAIALSAHRIVFIAKKIGAKEPPWAIFLAALPLGIGTLLGGAAYITLRRRYRLEEG